MSTPGANKTPCSTASACPAGESNSTNLISNVMSSERCWSVSCARTQLSQSGLVSRVTIIGGHGAGGAAASPARMSASSEGTGTNIVKSGSPP